VANLALIALTTMVHYASTPAQAAIHVLYPAKGRSVVVQRMNIVGRYATVVSRGGLMEGELITEPILVEHFSFGWQALEILNFRCRLDGHAISEHDKALLMRGMPKPEDDRPCKGVTKDAGPTVDVEAVRRQMRGPLVPHVVVSGNFALGEWYGGGGGESLFKKLGAAWHRIAGGGGAMGTADIKKYGVPSSAWCAFGIYDAKCPTKP
jgi:hypothetical protein